MSTSRIGIFKYTSTQAFASGSVMRLRLSIARSRSSSTERVEDTSIGDAAAPIIVRHFAAVGCVFLGDDYLIKGVAGRIFRALVADYVSDGRVTFNNRALRLDPRIDLPDISDNLEARLILLERRLVDRNACVRIEKTGRGRFRLVVVRPLKLVEV